MYRIRADEDLSFLLHKELEQLCIGKYDVQLHFHDNVGISIGGEEPSKSFQHKTSFSPSLHVPGFPGAAISLVSLLGEEVKRVVVEDPTTLALHFSNQEELRIYDNSDFYESFTISGPNRLIVV